MDPASRGKPRRRAPVAQWIELLVSTQSVGGSSPSGRTFTRENAPKGPPFATVPRPD
jgi:hypothetical protein